MGLGLKRARRCATNCIVDFRMLTSHPGKAVAIVTRNGEWRRRRHLAKTTEAIEQLSYAVRHYRAIIDEKQVRVMTYGVTALVKNHSFIHSFIQEFIRRFFKKSTQRRP